MAKVILSLDGQVLKEYELDHDRLTIGRKPNNDIQIENLAVSGQHAAITTIVKDVFLEDLGSTNGTLVNGRTIKKHLLQNGDVIEIGKHKLTFFDVYATVSAPEPDYEKTMIIRKPLAAAAPPPVPAPDTGGGPPTRAMSPQPLPADPAVTAAPTATAPAIGLLRLINGANAGKELELTKSLTSIGKPGVQVAVIAKRPQGFFISHVQGASLPTVNGRSVEGQAHQLRDHDVIELAGIRMEFFYRT